MMTLDAQFRTLDAAAAAPDTRQRARANALLEQIVSEQRSPRRTWNPRFAWRVGGVVAAGALVAAGAMVLPALTPALPAVATWTPEAGTVSPHDLPIAEQACRQQLERYDDSISETTPVVLAERRGDLVGLVLWQADPDMQGSCLVEMPVGASQVVATTSGVGGGSGPALVPPAQRFTEGALSEFVVQDGKVSMTSGAVGADVTAVTLHADGMSVSATVDHGRFVEWWPGAAFESGQFESGSGGPDDIISYDLTLADGTTVTDAEPWLP